MMKVSRKVAPLAVLLYLVRSADGMARRTTYFEDADCVRGVVQEYVYGATAIAPDGSTSPAPFNMCYTRGSTGAMTTCDPQDGTTAVEVYLDQECTNHVYTTSDGPRCVEITQEDPSSGPMSSSVECVDAGPSEDVTPDAFNLVGSPYADSHCTTRTGGEQVVRGSAFGVGAESCRRSALSRGRLPGNSVCMADGSVFSQLYAYSDESCTGDLLMEGVVFYGPNDPNGTGDELPGLCIGGEFEEGVVYFRLTSCTHGAETGPQPTPQYPTPAPAPATTPMPVVDNDDDDLSYSYGPDPSPDDDEDDDWEEGGGGDDGDDSDDGDDNDDGEDDEDDDDNGSGSDEDDDNGSGSDEDDDNGSGSDEDDDNGSGSDEDDDSGSGSDDSEDDGCDEKEDDDPDSPDDPPEDDDREPCDPNDEHSDDDGPCGDHGGDDRDDKDDDEEDEHPCEEGDEGCEDEEDDDEEADDDEEDDDEGGERGENVDAFETDGGNGDGDRSSKRLSGDAIFAIVFAVTIAILICVFSALLAILSREPTPQVGPKC